MSEIRLPELKEKVFIQSFKHDGSLHRTWAKGFVIESDAQRVILVTDQAAVTEANGRCWFTKDPAVCYFYFQRFYNVICMIRQNGVYYYCNLASPVYFDEEALKNIDYDLDIKVFPNGSYKLLDENEYSYHQSKLKYPEKLLKIIQETKRLLLQDIEQKNSPFEKGEVYFRYHRYLDLLQGKTAEK